ncbi:hypothetical protein N7528_006768 [Penicillium herquei]|nr:hypothetical protein N7528_006768 [Penicillium herquei]
MGRSSKSADTRLGSYKAESQDVHSPDQTPRTTESEISHFSDSPSDEEQTMGDKKTGLKYVDSQTPPPFNPVYETLVFETLGF